MLDAVARTKSCDGKRKTSPCIDKEPTKKTKIDEELPDPTDDPLYIWYKEYNVSDEWWNDILKKFEGPEKYKDFIKSNIYYTRRKIKKLKAKLKERLHSVSKKIKNLKRDVSHIFTTMDNLDERITNLQTI